MIYTLTTDSRGACLLLVPINCSRPFSALLVLSTPYLMHRTRSRMKERILRQFRLDTFDTSGLRQHNDALWAIWQRSRYAGSGVDNVNTIFVCMLQIPLLEKHGLILPLPSGRSTQKTPGPSDSDTDPCFEEAILKKLIQSNAARLGILDVLCSPHVTAY